MTVNDLLKHCQRLTYAQLASCELAIYRLRLNRMKRDPARVKRELAEHDRKNRGAFLSLR